MNQLRLEYRTAAELQDNPANWRTHPAAQLDALKAVLDDPEIGWAGVCLYNERTNRLIDGHGRKAVSAPDARIPVVIGNWSEEAERKILLTLDPLAGLAIADNAKLNDLIGTFKTDDSALTSLVDTLRPPAAAMPPTDFPQFDESISTEHQCPKCGYRYSGGSK